MTINRDFRQGRSPIIPLSFENKDIAYNKEFIVDYDDEQLYIYYNGQYYKLLLKIDDNKDTNEVLWSAFKIKQYINDYHNANDIMSFKGTIGVGGTVKDLPQTDYQAGWMYRIITDGTYAGQTGLAGGAILSIKDYSGSFNNNDWLVFDIDMDGIRTSANVEGVDFGKAFIPYVQTNGNMTIGKYIDFHFEYDGIDYSHRIQVRSDKSLEFSNDIRTPKLDTDIVKLGDAEIVHNTINKCIEFRFS